jgi:DnaJ-class molecular chaperone
MEALYSVLGLHSGATDGEVKSRYRRLVLELHPDKHPGDKSKEEQFRSVTFAYQTITDEEKRTAYLNGRSSSSHLSPLMEQEQQRAADNVYVAAMHFLFSEDSKRRQGLRAHYLPNDEEYESTADIISSHARAAVSTWLSSSTCATFTDALRFARHDWPHILVVVLMWCGLRFIAMC